jgi:hypothetical protein
MNDQALSCVIFTIVKSFSCSVSIYKLFPSRRLKDKQATIEQLQTSLDSEKREGKNFETIKSELSEKSKENLELVSRSRVLSYSALTWFFKVFYWSKFIGWANPNIN